MTGLRADNGETEPDLLCLCCGKPITSEKAAIYSENLLLLNALDFLTPEEEAFIRRQKGSDTSP